MKALIEVFQMTEISVSTRIKLIIALGKASNFENAANCTDDLVNELIEALSAPPERKIVQISEVGVEGSHGRWDADAWTTALCNDASVWRLHGGKDGVWYRMPTIPQDTAQ